MSSVLVKATGGQSPARRVLAVALVAFLPSVAHAGRLGMITISVDGKNWLTGRIADNGEAPPAVVWRWLASNELRPADGVTVPPDPADPLRTTLRGKIAIDVQYGGKAEVTELRLVRQTPSAGWTVDSLDVERIAKEIGLENVSGVVPQRAAGPTPGPPGQPPAAGFPWPWVAGGGAAVLAAVLIGVARARRVGSAGRADPGAPPR